MEGSRDVVIVGARCAGSPLAALLAREGVRVALVEQAEFPSDTLSSHVLEADGLALLDRLGLTDQVRATGAPFVTRMDNRADGFRMQGDWPTQPGDVGGVAAVRRVLLDPILAGAAADAGAEVHMKAKVTGLIIEAGRVAGVRVTNRNGGGELRARLVVGADGRSSAVARLCGARRYNPTPNQRMIYWAYFEGADVDEPTFVFHRWSNRLVLACPADSGLYMTGIMPDLADRERFRNDLERTFMDYVLSCEPAAQAVSGATRVDKIRGAVHWEGYFREAAGPGWVLTGDAGHFKDPAAGRGISDAFRQAEALAPAIAAGLRGSDRGLDDALADWARWRDEDFAEYYWFATDMGRAGTLTSIAEETMRAMYEEGRFRAFMEIQNHRMRPSQVLTPPRVFRTVGRMLARRGAKRLALLQELVTLLGREVKRRWLNRRPRYVA